MPGPFGADHGIGAVQPEPTPACHHSCVHASGCSAHRPNAQCTTRMQVCSLCVKRDKPLQTSCLQGVRVYATLVPPNSHENMAFSCDGLPCTRCRARPKPKGSEPPMGQIPGEIRLGRAVWVSWRSGCARTALCTCASARVSAKCVHAPRMRADSPAHPCGLEWRLQCVEAARLQQCKPGRGPRPQKWGQSRTHTAGSESVCSPRDCLHRSLPQVVPRQRSPTG